MPENSVAKPAGPDEVEEEFMETLRQAVFIFEREKDGRFHGSIFACKAGWKQSKPLGCWATWSGSIARFKTDPDETGDRP